MKNKEILAIVYPYGLSNKYLRFYDEFLRKYLFEMQDDIRIILIVTNIQAKQVLEDKFPDNKFEILLIPEAVDIWIRDWAPIPLKFNNGKTFYLKPDFTTGYYKGYYESFIPKLKSASARFCDYLGIKTFDLSLKTDGGNFAFNGKDTLVLTNRIISNNEHLSVSEIKNIFSNSFGIRNVYFIPVEPGDVTGHTDGILRFINEKTLIIGKYNKMLKEENKFITDLVKQFISETHHILNIIRLENQIINDEGINSVVASATGNYINFLIIGKRIFLPFYGLDSDNKNFNTLTRRLKEYNIIKVEPKDITKISKDGGVLNCITWNN